MVRWGVVVLKGGGVGLDGSRNGQHFLTSVLSIPLRQVPGLLTLRPPNCMFVA